MVGQEAIALPGNPSPTLFTVSTRSSSLRWAVYIFKTISAFDFGIFRVRGFFPGAREIEMASNPMMMECWGNCDRRFGRIDLATALEVNMMV